MPDTATLPRGRLSFAVTLDNRDRDPLGLDIMDGAVAWRSVSRDGARSTGSSS